MINKTTPSLYKLHFPMIPEAFSINQQKQFTVFITGTLLPSITLNDETLPYMGQDLHMDGGGLEFGQWATSFHIDEKWESYLLFYNWMVSINNGQTKFGSNSFDHQINGFLSILDNYQKEILTWKFHRVWPIELGDVELSYADDAIDVEANVTLQYDFFEIDK